MSWFVFTTLFCLAALTPLARSVEPCVDKSSQCKAFAQYCGQGSMPTFCPITCKTCPNNPCPQENNGGCSHTCSWVNEKVECGCPPGFKLGDDKSTCVDINECTEGPNPCSKLFAQQYCVNTVGSYFCVESNECPRDDSGTMNYYRSQKCCNVKNTTCGMTADIRSKLPQEPQGLTREPRIFGGFQSALSAWPWMAQLVSNGQHTCGGTLLTKSWILTAAHCLSGTTHDRNIKVFLGHVQRADLFARPGRRVERGVKKVIIHDEPAENDIALIELSSPVEFDDFVSPVCLPCGDKPLTGDICWATGFGSTSANVVAPAARLREVDLPLVGIKECIKAFQGTNTDINRATMMCAGYHSGGKDACYGDGGGPLVCQRKDSCSWYISGITAFGQGCGNAGTYGVYTNVLRFEDWIKEQMGVVDASELCKQNYDPCSGFTNIARGCENNANACGSKDCELTCCQRKFEREPNCFDAPGFGVACKIFKDKCEDPAFESYMKTNCRKTCAYC